MRKDLSGQRFGLLRVSAYLQKSIWLCVCDCGNEVKRAASELTKWAKPSCGCIKSANVAAAQTTHGGSNSQLYKVYTSMKARCNNPNDKKFHLYGGRGITVCERWSDSFAAFVADMGERPQGSSIEREDGNLGYFKENCRWASVTEQNRNLSSNVLSPEMAALMRLLKAGGHTIREISKLTRTSYQNAYDVLARNRWAVKP